MTTLKIKYRTQDFINTSFSKKNIKDRNMYNQIMRRATLTNTPITHVIKEYVELGIQNDKFLQLFDEQK